MQSLHSHPIPTPCPNITGSPVVSTPLKEIKEDLQSSNAFSTPHYHHHYTKSRFRTIIEVLKVQNQVVFQLAAQTAYHSQYISASFRTVHVLSLWRNNSSRRPCLKGV